MKIISIIFNVKRNKPGKKVLLGNRKKGYTLPTNNNLYPAQWNWDSGFIALGYSHFNLKYAFDEINTLFRRSMERWYGPSYFIS